MQDKKQMHFIDDPESRIMEVMPNLMKLSMIDNPDQHVRDDKFVEMFKHFIKYRDNIYSE